MKHLDSGELRRMIDEPQTFSNPQREHARTCSECRARLEDLREHARTADDALAGEPEIADAAAAYHRVSARAAIPSRVTQLYRPLAAVAAAAAFALALALTPLGGYARSFLTIFEPRQFTPIEISRADLQSLHLLPQANDVGTQRMVRKPQRTRYSSFEQARKRVGFALLQPTMLPRGFGQVHNFFAMTPAEMTFTFSAVKARAFERRSHKNLPPMPAGLDGTTVRLQTGFAFQGDYEARAKRGSSKVKGMRDSRSFELVEAQAPSVTSTGASLDTLERYLLSMPNVSPQLARQIRALGDIQSTVPVPVVIDKQTAQRVTVNGTPALAIGDNTGLGAGVMWQKNGKIYVVAGPLTMDEIMTVASGLR